MRMSAKHFFAFLLGAVVSAAIAAVLWRMSAASPERLRKTLLEKPEFLADHPEILDAAAAVLQTRALARRGAERAALIQGKWQALTHVAFTPTIGSPDAPLVLLEFTDYTCEPCRKSASVVNETLSGSSDVRVAVLLLPIGGALAEYAAQIALAAYRQNPDRYAELHQRLMQLPGQLTQEAILAVASELGFDMEQLEREAVSTENRRYFDQVRMFAEDLRISGVPAFSLNEQLVLGGVTRASLETMIGSARTAREADRPRWAATETGRYPSYSLVDQHGRPMTEKTFRGEWLIVFFGFTHCPDFCPTTLYRLSKTLDELGVQAQNVRVAFITVDPERDAPQVLEAYLHPFGPKFTGGTGTVQQVAAATRAFRTYSVKQAPSADGTYAVTHSTSLYVVSPDGRLSRQLSSQATPEQLAASLRALDSLRP
jgi:protein SCO1